MEPVDPITLSELKNRQQKLHLEIKRIQREASHIDDQLKTLTQTQPTETKQTPPPIPKSQIQPEQKTTPTPTQEKQPIPKPTFTPPIPKKSPEPPTIKPDWELQLGKIWFVRIGILSLLTGLVFLSTYAYQNWLALAPATTKLTVFMTISLALAGFGMIFEKKKKDLENYGRVITAGGLAAAYYTIYAAHFVTSLKIITSPALAATALTIWAAIMLFYACWKQSKIIASISLGLAFYATIMNPTGWLSIFSALLLSASGITLLIRYQWTKIGIGTAIAAYISHAFWLGIYPHHATELTRFTYLACYWLLFTTAITIPAAKKLPAKILNTIAAINNAGTWTLAVFILPLFAPHPYLGEISIGLGALFLTIAYLAKNNKIFPSQVSPTYAYQAIFIITLGIIITAAGYARFLVLAAEACLLIAAGHKHKNHLIKLASAPVFAIALIAALPLTEPTPAWPPYLALALISATYAYLIRRTNPDTELSNNAALAIIPASIAWLILALGVTDNWELAHRVPSLLTIALAITISHISVPKLSFLRDLTLTTPIPILLATAWHLDSAYPSAASSILLTPTITALIVAYWFLTPHIHNLAKKTLHYQAPKLPSNACAPCRDTPLGILVGIAATLVTAFTLDKFASNNFTSWLYIPGLTAIAFHLISDRTKRLSLTIPALTFHLAAAFITLQSLLDPPSITLWLPALIIIAHLALTETILKSLNQNLTRPLAALTTNIALIIPITINTINTINTTQPAIIFTAIAIAFHIFAKLKKDTPTSLLGAKLALILANLLTIPHFHEPTIITYIPLLTAIIIHALPHPSTQKPNLAWIALHRLSLTATIIYLFATVTQDTTQLFNGAGLSIAWASLALIIFTIGLIMNYRPYRYTGLATLALAILHVITIDVMKFETLGRILAFIILGIILIILGYLYNRFQDHIKKFL